MFARGKKILIFFVGVGASLHAEDGSLLEGAAPIVSATSAISAAHSAAGADKYRSDNENETAQMGIAQGNGTARQGNALQAAAAVGQAELAAKTAAGLDAGKTTRLGMELTAQAKALALQANLQRQQMFAQYDLEQKKLALEEKKLDAEIAKLRAQVSGIAVESMNSGNNLGVQEYGVALSRKVTLPSGEISAPTDRLLASLANTQAPPQPAETVPRSSKPIQIEPVLPARALFVSAPVTYSRHGQTAPLAVAHSGHTAAAAHASDVIRVGR